MTHPDWRTPLIERQRWMLYLLPFVVYMLAGSLEPSPEQPGGKAVGLAIPYSYYPWLYTAKIALTVAAIAVVWPGYRQFPRRVTLLAIVVGVASGPLWIALCQLDYHYVAPFLKQAGLGWITAPANGLASTRMITCGPSLHCASWPSVSSAWWPWCR